MPRFPPNAADLPTAAFGGGCHWCTEAVFDSLRGVAGVRQGFAASAPPHDSLSEAALVTYDPERIGLGVLMDIHVRTHAATSQHKLRGKYRSAVYVTSSDQASQAGHHLSRIAAEMGLPLVTIVMPLHRFEESPEMFRRYYARNRGKPFCNTYIDPKLRLLKKQYAEYLSPEYG